MSEQSCSVLLEVLNFPRIKRLFNRFENLHLHYEFKKSHSEEHELIPECEQTAGLAGLA